MHTIELRQPVEIEALLIWTYRHQRADTVIDRGMGLFDQEGALDGRVHYATSTDGVATMQRIGLLGTRVDGGGASASHLHPDAEIVHEAVMALDRPVAMMVIRYAKSASRPEPSPPPRPYPVRNARGKIVREYAEWDKSKHYGWTPIDWTAQAVTAAAAAAEMTLWRKTLTVLAMALSRDGRLTRHIPYVAAESVVAALYA